MEVEESEFNPDFVKHMLPKLDWAVFRDAARTLGAPTLPDAAPEVPDDAFLKAVHTALMDVHVKNGKLECPKCARQYPIVNGIPNLLLHPDEVRRK